MATASAAPRVFVSYARSDGKEIAADLRRRLQAEGFALWQDLTDMAASCARGWPSASQSPMSTPDGRFAVAGQIHVLEILLARLMEKFLSCANLLRASSGAFPQYDL